ncbi:MAG: hypothetical protein N3A58_06505 [Spirochaetes bacterium]|nr:hypothetical protein [Spirochaetota bacterium]
MKKINLINFIKSKIKIRLIFIFFISISLFSCSINNYEKNVSQGQILEQKSENRVKVIGQDPDFNKAKMNAYMLACKYYVILFIGEQREKENIKKITENIYNNPLKFIIEYKILDKYTSGGVVNVVMEIVINIEKIRNTLISIGLLNTGSSNMVSNQQSSTSLSSSSTTQSVQSTIDDLFGIDDVEVMKAINSMKPEEVKIVKNYVKNMIYMVYYDETKIKENLEYFKFTVSRINNFFSSRNIEYVDPDYINELKKDAEIIRLATQGGVSELQLVADRIGADVYTVVDIAINKRQESNRYIAQVNLTLKMFEAATARGLGEEIGISDELFSNSSFDVVIRACIDNAVKKVMEKMIKSVQYKMFLAFKDGIRYKVVLHNVQTTKNRLEFEQAIMKTKGFRSLKPISATKDEASYFVYYMGTLEEFELELFKILATVGGFENFDEVIKRRNSIEFKI